MSDSKSGSILRTVWSKVQHMYGLDRRSLAFYRFLFGLIALQSILERMMDLRVLYTNEGMFPRKKVLSIYTHKNIMIFHNLNGTFEFQLFLFSFHAIICLLLAIGYKTRIVAFINFLLVTSVAAYVPFVNSAADQVLRLYSFWLIFMPVSEVCEDVFDNPYET